jgi:hypothetical protein
VVLDGGKKSAAENKKKLPLRFIKSHAPFENSPLPTPYQTPETR